MLQTKCLFLIPQLLKNRVVFFFTLFNCCLMFCVLCSHRWRPQWVKTQRGWHLDRNGWKEASTTHRFPPPNSSLPSTFKTHFNINLQEHPTKTDLIWSQSLWPRLVGPLLNHTDHRKSHRKSRALSLPTQKMFISLLWITWNNKKVKENIIYSSPFVSIYILSLSFEVILNVCLVRVCKLLQRAFCTWAVFHDFKTFLCLHLCVI